MAPRQLHRVWAEVDEETGFWFSDTFYRNSYHHWRVSTTLIYFRFTLDEKYLSVLISNFPILLICDLWCGVTFPACLQTSSLVITEWYEDQWQWSLITCNYWPQTWQTGHPVLTRDPISLPELRSQPRPRSRLRIIKISIKWSKSFSLSRLRLSQMPSVLASTIWCLVSGLSARLKLKVTFLTIVNENWN